MSKIKTDSSEIVIHLERVVRNALNIDINDIFLRNNMVLKKKKYIFSRQKTFSKRGDIDFRGAKLSTPSLTQDLSILVASSTLICCDVAHRRGFGRVQCALMRKGEA